MNTQIRRLGIVLLVLFSALFIQLNYLQIIQADDLNNHPANSRAVVRDFTRPRGVIQTSDGAVVAQSVPSNDAFKLQRQYPLGPLFAHVTGYFSFTYGSEGVEKEYNDALTGRLSDNRFDPRDLLVEKDKTANVTLTLSRSLQELATAQLGDRKGSVVALDPRNGAILAFADYPTYDPNTLASHNQDAVRSAWTELNGDPDKPLLPRTYRERYPPGSSFKVVTTATALATGTATPTQPVYPALRELPLPQAGGQTLANFGGGTCGGPLPEALRISCNTAFAQLGLDLGAQKLSAGAEAFGFNEVPPIDLPYAAASFFPPASAFARDQPGLAKSAIGQQDVSATPMQMALVAAGIANNGVIMAPHVMAEVRDAEGEVIQRYEPKPWTTAAPPDVARATRDMMVNVVERGSGTRAQIPGVSVAGKTGTAQTGLDKSHVWFIAFAPADAPRVAVAVMLEDQPSATEFTGGALAAPIAQAVMRAALAP
ncbi:MAG TPA: penicillin-binding protein 2 [Acidimicrobiales bacterium]|nr:penicillin-binding protein 2 [Acidimicrobiales bacterium]